MLNKKHQSTLKAIFALPIKSGIQWKAIEALLLALGAELSEGRGSRLRIVLNHRKAVFHRPHPQKETDKGAVVSIKRFLQEAGVSNVKI
ncbi:MAG: type II toxin-antitoxin system HicA family toxin [Pseudomonadota bacterium]